MLNEKFVELEFKDSVHITKDLPQVLLWNLRERLKNKSRIWQPLKCVHIRGDIAKLQRLKKKDS